VALNSHIEWTEATWNPVTGCNPVSEGCEHCYAQRMALRLHAMGNASYRNGFRLTLHEHLVDAPLHWRKPRLVFVNSMSDLFHANVPFDFISRVFAVMRECHWHVFQVLTKRPKKLKAFAERLGNWPANVWPGVTVETARHYDRVHILQSIPAQVRFLSCEPLLGPLDRLPLQGIHWIIVGGESGPGARPMDANWVRSLRRQCKARDVSFFFKQWGGVRKDLTGRVLDGRVYEAMPELLSPTRELAL
jgi:protein gp37